MAPRFGTVVLLLVALPSPAAAPASAHPATAAPPPFWAVNASCLAACERFCASSTACRAISFGRNFNHGLECNFHACANLTSKRDDTLWVTYTRDAASKDGAFTQHNWTVTSCVNPQRPPLSDYNCMRPGPPPGPPPPPPPPPPPVNNCTAAQLSRPRHASLWLPGVAPGRGSDTARYIAAHASAYDTLSMTWAFWNSGWNNKCNGTLIGRDSGLCGRAWSADERLVVAAAKAAKWRVVPILEVCCVCVLNASYDYRAPMAALVADARQFDGYVLDMICGGHDEPQRITFLNALKAELAKAAAPANGAAADEPPEVSWFSHGFYHPERTFPNGADFLYDMGAPPSRIALLRAGRQPATALPADLLPCWFYCCRYLRAPELCPGVGWQLPVPGRRGSGVPRLQPARAGGGDVCDAQQPLAPPSDRDLGRRRERQLAPGDGVVRRAGGLPRRREGKIHTVGPKFGPISGL
jgi:hypothetical protein